MNGIQSDTDGMKNKMASKEFYFRMGMLPPLRKQNGGNMLSHAGQNLFWMVRRGAGWSCRRGMRRSIPFRAHLAFGIVTCPRIRAHLGIVRRFGWRLDRFFSRCFPFAGWSAICTGTSGCR